MSIIAFQGCPGAYSDLACRQVRPDWKTLPCLSFATAVEAVHQGRADEALLACENSLVGRVPEIHALMPKADLYVVGEHFHRVEHCLLVVPGTALEDIRAVHTHPVALGQIRRLIETLGVEGVPQFDTAGAAEMVARWGRRTEAAVASSLAGTLNGLYVLKRNVEDEAHNTTRFYRVSRHAHWPPPSQDGVMTTLLMRLPNEPGALYGAIGSFARNGLNVTRLESYMLEGSFAATQFLLDIEGHPEHKPLRLALGELEALSDSVKILGVYPCSAFRT